MKQFLRNLLMQLVFAAFLLGGGTFGCGSPDMALLEERPASPIANESEVIRAIRRGLKEHSSEITVRFTTGADILEELGDMVPSWMEKALDETGDPAEGDYIRYRTGGYDYRCERSRDGDSFRYAVYLTPEYYTYRTQEEKVSSRVAEIMDSLGSGSFSKETDKERIRRIYEWVCSNITYDKVHRKNPYRHDKATAYSALIRGTATCQGYCAALYRLLREAGIECRIVTGRAESEELHAWVIARPDPEDPFFYILDPTYDAGLKEYRHYLLGRQSLPDRVPEERFLTADFRNRYPLSDSDWEER